MSAAPTTHDPGSPTRALAMSTIAFTTCFAVWTIFSIIGVEIKKELGLSEFQFGLLVATPILTGSVTRLFLGVWTERALLRKSTEGARSLSPDGLIPRPL